MVKRALLVFALTCALVPALAQAESPPDEDLAEVAEDPAFNMLGFRIGVGGLPLAGQRTAIVALGVGVEHPVFRKTRVFGEYEWLWLLYVSERAMAPDAPRLERYGTGHRAWLGVRRELLGKRLGFTRMFLDGELGGGSALVNDNMSGLDVIPSALVGVRFGYDMYSRSDDSPSRTFEAELSVRAIAVRDGIGMMCGIGMLWGN